MSSSIKNLIQHQYSLRTGRQAPSIKVNLYTEDEIIALSKVLDEMTEWGEERYPDCIMIADSYLTTHLGRSTTKLSMTSDQEWFLDIMVDLVTKSKRAINNYIRERHRTNLYLIADMPSGSCKDNQTAQKNAERFMAAGADALKFEVNTESDFKILNGLCSSNLVVIAHLGFTPQSAENRTYGVNIEESYEIFRKARAARDAGASGIVLERVTQPVNQALSSFHGEDALPIYSIFSGKSQYGGQSLNVWDAVFNPPYKAKFFPPTAKYLISDYPSAYTVETIKNCFLELLKLTLAKTFPKDPKHSLSEQEVREIISNNPWKNSS